MKYVTLLFLAVVTLNANSQVSFPENHPDLLKGKKVKITEPEFFEKFGYENLYKDKKALMESYSNLPKDEQRKLLTGKEFTVEEIGPANKGFGGSYDYILTLKASDGTVIYQRYNSRVTFDYPLEVIGGLDLPEGFYCELITKNDGINLYETVGNIDGISIDKNLNSDDIPLKYTVSYVGFLKRDAINTEGLKLIFDNGKKLESKIAKSFTEYTSNGNYRYTQYIMMTEKEFDMLVNHKITAVVLDGTTMPVKEGEKIKAVAKCMKDIK